jgi:hypothetical protein
MWRLGGLLRGGWLAQQTLSDVMAETVGWTITDDGGETRRANEGRTVVRFGFVWLGGEGAALFVIRPFS